MIGSLFDESAAGCADNESKHEAWSDDETGGACATALCHNQLVAR